MSLTDAARMVRENAYAPYSRFKVGAAIRAASGQVYVGCNVENVAYPEGTCAEAGAIAAMVAAGETQLVEVCVIADSPDPVPPCGGCRQKLAEFDDPALMKVFAAGGIGVIALPMVARHEAGTRYDLQHLGTAESVRETYQIISPDRRMTHPAVLTMSKQARETVFGAGGGVIGLPVEVR